MNYLPGDCLSISLSDEYYIVVFVAMSDEYSYHLAFLDYYEVEEPSDDYFQNGSFFVMTFGTEEQQFAAFDAVTIDKSVLDNDPGITLAKHLELPGRIGLNGMTPMADVSEIASYFEQYLKNYELQEPEQFSPFKRTLMGVDELVKFATSINPFETIKLYKEDGPVIYFWQIYGVPEPACLVLSQGKLGQVGEYQEIKDMPLDSLKEMYTRLIGEKREQGFGEWEKFSNLTLQFQTNDAWGAGDDLTFRNDIWEYLDRYLFWTGNGAITGGDIGSGTVNLFFHAISPDMAVTTITAALAEKQISRPFIIALEDENITKQEPPFGIRVLYPGNYDGDFNY